MPTALQRRRARATVRSDARERRAMTVRGLIVAAFALCVPPAIVHSAPALVAPPRLRLSLYPASPHQGETLFVIVRPGPMSGPLRCTWDGATVPTSPTPDAFVATIGVRITESPGVHSLRLEYSSPDGILRTESRGITVRRTAWRVQRLRMKRSTERLYNFPGARQEDAQVTAATRAESPAMLWRGRFLIPTRGRLATPFGVKRIRNGRTTYYHRGLDLAAPTGTPVLAPNAGRVVLARVLKKYGHTVVLDHGLGVTSLYIHMSAFNVREGDHVDRGQLIGRVGAEGVATGPHLHWSLYVHGNAVSPLFWTRLPVSVTTALAPPGE